MPQFILLYDAVCEAKVQDKIVPLLLSQQPTLYAWQATCLPAWPKGARIITFLPDAALAQLIPQAIAQGWVLGLLPHPDMQEVAKGFKVPANLEKAIKQLDFEADPILVDQLYCNDKPVFNAVSIGDPFGLRAAY